MASKKFRMKKSLVPSDPSLRGKVEVTMRWREASRMGARQLQKTIGPDDILEGDTFEQFVPEYLEEVVEVEKAVVPKVEKDEPKADEPNADEPNVDEPKADEPKVEETKASDGGGRTTTKTINRGKKR